jgi:hypothetical protein
MPQHCDARVGGRQVFEGMHSDYWLTFLGVKAPFIRAG